ncbi:hypothetical protein Ccrd_008386 [Cynara cardunculus var. scolymus]|uniref:Uncharacterized protein n=1 Tax=Cynara cardunculus var. scolymus TaxID=59895 RepID=A0A103XF80_CYNCS|nr:hypothetical protein Ccrd_008386 [Cynara cardunculus var. scolymus]
MNAQNLDLRSSLVNWVGPDDHHFPNLENSKHTDSLLEFEENSVDSDDGNDKDFNGNEIEQKDDNLEGEKQCTDSLCIGNYAVGHGDTIEKERINMKLSMQIKSQKMPFCPKEVTRILKSKELFLKNAQSHTVRKIIVFASLGIKHGCEDMYNLDFNHFKILQKGAPYESPQNPGEHVVYENPGVRKKIFYPNRRNPTLCPIRILEEEKEMRPHDITCPSCLFLCIKYGGSTRNLPQQEYVRQQMGRNKLKSFGPIICRMAMLAHVRDGSFFFKALGITLLFMAGFSDDLLGTPSSRRLTGKSKTSKKHILPNHTSNYTPSTSSTRTQFAFLDFNSSQTRAIQSMISQTLAGPSNFYYPNQSPYPIFPPHLANSFMPMMYWPPPNAFPPPFTYQSFSSSGNYISTHSQPLFTHVSSNTLEPNMVNYVVKNGPGLEKTDNDSREVNKDNGMIALLQENLIF